MCNVKIFIFKVVKRYSDISLIISDYHTLLFNLFCSVSESDATGGTLSTTLELTDWAQLINLLFEPLQRWNICL